MHAGVCSASECGGREGAVSRFWTLAECRSQFLGPSVDWLARMVSISRFSCRPARSQLTLGSQLAFNHGLASEVVRDREMLRPSLTACEEAKCFFGIEGRSRQFLLSFFPPFLLEVTSFVLDHLRAAPKD